MKVSLTLSRIAVFLFFLTACTAAPITQEPQPAVSTNTPVQPTETLKSENTPYPAPDAAPISQPEPYPLPGDLPVSSDDPIGAYPPPLGDLAPQSGDKNLLRGPVFLEQGDSGLMVMESFPVQVTLSLSGNLPTPCHQLRAVVTTSADEKRVDVELYTLTDPTIACIDMLSPFQAELPLGSFSGGKFSVYINGELFGTFDA